MRPLRGLKRPASRLERRVTDLVDMSLSKLREMAMDRGAWRAAVHGVRWSQIDTRLDEVSLALQ